MRYGIFADIHANLEALDKVIAAYKNEAIDKYLCLGDIVGYATNPNECCQKVKEIASITVAGNHDWASVDLFSLNYFNRYAKEAILWTKEHLSKDNGYFLSTLKLVYQNEDLTLVHGTLNNPADFNYLIDIEAAQETFKLMQTKVCFVGHSHVPGIFVKDKNGYLGYLEDNLITLKDQNYYIINVGSVGQPRDGSPLATYCIYDTEKKEVSIKRVSYDFQTTRKKIIQAGLPAFLGNRLMIGR